MFFSAHAVSLVKLATVGHLSRLKANALAGPTQKKRCRQFALVNPKFVVSGNLVQKKKAPDPSGAFFLLLQSLTAQ